jgi:hypothetical protein
MTMPNAFHPDDERLAAYADAAADALGDRDLAGHLDGCDRCRAIVDDLAALPAILAALPDIAPPRPLRLLPPVPAVAPTAGGPATWLRRLAGPVFAAGTGLVLIGAIGVSGALEVFSGSASMAGPDANASGDLAPLDESSQERASDTQHAIQSPAGEPLASSEGAAGNHDGEALDNQRAATQAPWMVVLSAGLALILGAAALRFALQPRAG